MSTGPPLRVLLISDGRPGHYHLAEGIVSAIGRRRPTAVSHLDVRLPRWAGRPAALAVNGGLPPGLILRRGYGLDPAALPASDLVLSAGAATLAANVAAARYLAVPNVFYGSLRRFRPADFTLALSSYESAGDARNQIAVLKPPRFDPDTIPPPVTLRGPPERAGLVVGGPTATIAYMLREWERLIAFLAASHRAHGTRWLVATSPRTPPEAGDLLAAAAADPDGGIARFTDYRTSGPGSLAPLLADAQAILCTDDSSAMVSEAIAARRPVAGALAAAATHPPQEQRYRDYLAHQGWYRALPIASLSPESWVEAVAALRPPPGNVLDDLADLLARFLPALVPAARRPP